MRNVVIKNITDRADKAANNWEKTRDPKYKEEWYNIIKEINGLTPTSNYNSLSYMNKKGKI